MDAEKALQEAGRRFRDYIFQFKEARAALPPKESKWVQDTEDAVYAAHLALARAAFEEGQVRVFDSLHTLDRPKESEMKPLPKWLTETSR